MWVLRRPTFKKRGLSRSLTPKKRGASILARMPSGKPSGKAVALVVVGSQAGQMIRGRAAPGADIEAVNLSRSAADPMGAEDPTRIARADDRGRFAGPFAMREGDVVRVRARAKRGPTESVLFDARATGRAPRAPRVALFRIGLVPYGEARVAVVNLSASRPLAAPGVCLRFLNSSTGETLDLVTNEKGSLPGRPLIGARAGETLSVAVIAGRSRHVGELSVPSAEPLPRGAVKPCARLQRLGAVPERRVLAGPLFVGRPRAADVFQSELSNCHVASAAAAVAHVQPAVLARAIVARDAARSSYRVRLFRRGSRRAEDIVLDAQLFVRPSGDLLYGAASLPPGSPRSPTPRALWWPLLEKAFASRKGSYKSLGDGGCADLVLADLLGRSPHRFFVDGGRPGEDDRVFSELSRAFAERRPVCAGTWTGQPRRYVRTGLVPNHAYTVLGCRSVRGRRFVTVRNPWGEEAMGPPRRRGGALELPLEVFVRLFCVVQTVR